MPCNSAFTHDNISTHLSTLRCVSPFLRDAFVVLGEQWTIFQAFEGRLMALQRLEAGNAVATSLPCSNAAPQGLNQSGTDLASPVAVAKPGDFVVTVGLFDP
jgi:hypothetical protein